MSRRSDRVAEAVRAELSAIMMREMRDPRLGMATVSRVELAGDLSHAVVGVSVLGSDEERDGAVAVLERARGFLRSQLARRLQLRAVPELVFKLDRGAEHSQHMSDLLESLHDDDDP